MSVNNMAEEPNLVLNMPLDRLEGSSFMSKDAYGHMCTATGTLMTLQGRSFDGIDDVINCGSDEVLDNLGTTGDYKFTVEAWINPTSLGETSVGRIVDKSFFVLNVLATATAKFRILVGGTEKKAVAANNSTPFGSWTHVVGVFNGVNVLIYTNLTLTTGDVTTGPADNHSAYSFLIGDRAGSDYCFDGLIGEVRMYNRALSLTEITRNYQMTKWRYR